MLYIPSKKELLASGFTPIQDFQVGQSYYHYLFRASRYEVLEVSPDGLKCLSFLVTLEGKPQPTTTLEEVLSYDQASWLQEVTSEVRWEVHYSFRDKSNV